VYPPLRLLEAVLSKHNPFVALGKLCVGGFANQFNGDAELLDDLNDHWTSTHHKAERSRFIDRLQRFAYSRRIRISFLTGDVHCAAVGVLKTLAHGWRHSAPEPALDYRYMLNIVTSAIVNSPPPHGAITLVNFQSKRHRMHDADTDEEMVPVFERDTDGSRPQSHYLMGRRNWCSVTLIQHTGDLLFDIRVEKEKGHGETVGYPILAPPPRWTPTTSK